MCLQQCLTKKAEQKAFNWNYISLNERSEKNVTVSKQIRHTIELDILEVVEFEFEKVK